MTPATHDHRWRTSQVLTRVFFAALNGEIDLKPPATRRFPKDDPSQWDTWGAAAVARINARRELKLTDAAFRNVADLLTASETVAAKVVVAAPSEDDLAKIQEGLEKINDAIKADERFHAAVDLGVALAGEVEKMRA
jgi:hypothetical protein